MMKGLRSFSVTILLTVLATLAVAQVASEYKPKFPGDPARSEVEAQALGYMRVVVNAQKNYSQKHNGDYATSLNALVGHGSFTRRMVNPNRGDYTVKFRGGKKEYSLWLTPNVISPTERAFFVDESGVIHADETQQAGPESPKVQP